MHALDAIMTAAVESANKSDTAAGTIIVVITSGGLALMLLVGSFIAWKASKAVTDPLNQLIAVAGQIPTPATSIRNWKSAVKTKPRNLLLHSKRW